VGHRSLSKRNATGGRRHAPPPCREKTVRFSPRREKRGTRGGARGRERGARSKWEGEADEDREAGGPAQPALRRVRCAGPQPSRAIARMPRPQGVAKARKGCCKFLCILTLTGAGWCTWAPGKKKSPVADLAVHEATAKTSHPIRLTAGGTSYRGACLEASQIGVEVQSTRTIRTRDGTIMKITRSSVKFEASSRCRHPTKTRPSKSRTSSPSSVGKPEVWQTRALRFPERAQIELGRPG